MQDAVAGSHELVRIVYSSRSLLHGKRAEVAVAIHDILETARSANLRNNITGVLFFNGRSFAQALEGTPPAIDRLFANIVRDQRHTDICVLQREIVKTRCFGAWAMAYVEGGEGKAFTISPGFLSDVMNESGGIAGAVLDLMRFVMLDH